MRNQSLFLGKDLGNALSQFVLHLNMNDTNKQSRGRMVWKTLKRLCEKINSLHFDMARSHLLLWLDIRRLECMYVRAIADLYT